MKTTFTTIVGLFILVASACQQDSFLDENQEQNNNNAIPRHYVPNLNVSFETAKYAANLLSHSTVKSVTPIVSQPRDTIMYAVNCEKGWLLLSADKRITPILASSPTGEIKQNSTNGGVATLLNDFADNLLSLKHHKQNYELSELKKNENFLFWSRMMWGAANKSEKISAEGTAAARVIPISPNDQGIPYLCKRLVSVTPEHEQVTYIGERIKTKWGQRHPWNTKLPWVETNDKKKILPPVGCTAVAIAQLLYFTHFKFNVPDGLYHGTAFGGYITADKKNKTFFSLGQYVANSPRWNEMPLDRSIITEGASYVAELMAGLGYQLNMEYTPEASRAYVSTEVMRSYGITGDVGFYNESTVMRNIHDGCPLLITAYAKKSTTGWFLTEHARFDEGHTWLIDGIVERRKEMKTKYVWEIVYLPMWVRPREEHSPNKPKTIDDLWNKYEEVQPMSNAKYFGIYDGKVEYKSNFFDTINIQMNWGWNGDDNDLEFSSNADVWSAGGHQFQYYKVVWRNIRPIK